MLFGNLYIYFDWNGRTEIPGKRSRSSQKCFRQTLLTDASSSLLLFSSREQQEKHLPVSAGGLHPGNAELPGVEGQQPRGGDALRGGGTPPAPGPRHVNPLFYQLACILVAEPLVEVTRAKNLSIISETQMTTEHVSS